MLSSRAVGAPSPWLCNCLAVSPGGAVSFLGEGMSLLNVDESGCAGPGPSNLGVSRPMSQAWSADGTLLVVGARQQVVLFQRAAASAGGSGALERVYSKSLHFEPRGSAVANRIGRGGATVVAVAGVAGVEIYFLGASWQQIGATLRVQPEYNILHVSFAPSGRFLALATLEGHLGVWETAFIAERNGAVGSAPAAAEDEIPPAAHTDVVTQGRVTTVLFSHVGSMLAVMTWDGILKVYQEVQRGRWHNISGTHLREPLCASQFLSEHPPPLIAWTLNCDGILCVLPCTILVA